MLVSAKHQQSAVDTHMFPPSWASFPPPSSSHPSRLLQSSGVSSLSHTANSHWLSILHTVMYVSTLLSRYLPSSSAFCPHHTIFISLFSMSVPRHIVFIREKCSNPKSSFRTHPVQHVGTQGSTENWITRYASELWRRCKLTLAETKLSSLATLKALTLLQLSPELQGSLRYFLGTCEGQGGAWVIITSYQATD